MAHAENRAVAVESTKFGYAVTEQTDQGVPVLPDTPDDIDPDTAGVATGGLITPILLGLFAFLAAAGMLFFAVGRGGDASGPNMAGNAAVEAALERLAQEIRADREATTARLGALERDTGLITGSVPTPVTPPTVIDAPAIVTPFGADLGRAASVRALRDRWFALIARDKSLTRHEARLFVRETANGQVFSLLVGPFDNAADAASLCARLAKESPNCVPAPFEGQRLPGSSGDGL
jgi:hypothetical protein